MYDVSFPSGMSLPTADDIGVSDRQARDATTRHRSSGCQSKSINGRKFTTTGCFNSLKSAGFSRLSLGESRLPPYSTGRCTRNVMIRVTTQLDDRDLVAAVHALGRERVKRVIQMLLLYRDDQALLEECADMILRELERRASDEEG